MAMGRAKTLDGCAGDGLTGAVAVRRESVRGEMRDGEAAKTRSEGKGVPGQQGVASNWESEPGPLACEGEDAASPVSISEERDSFVIAPVLVALPHHPHVASHYINIRHRSYARSCVALARPCNAPKKPRLDATYPCVYSCKPALFIYSPYLPAFLHSFVP